MYNEDHPIRIHFRSAMSAGYGKISDNFLFQEWFCKCGECENQPVHTEMFPMLEKLREALGNKPMKITSGYRCPKHNAKVGGAPKSRHMIGDAADIKVKGCYPDEVARAAKMVGFTGIKVYRSWTHVDLRPGTPWYVGFDQVALEGRQ